MTQENMPKRVDDFMKTLEDMIGYGARVIEKLVIAGLVGGNHVAPYAVQGKRLVEIVNATKPLQPEHFSR